MGMITRHTGAPFADGEVLAAGAEGDPDGLEFDMGAFYAEFNGAADDVNFKTGADLSGTKLLLNSLALAKVANSAIDATVFLDDSIEDSKISDTAITDDKIAANALSNQTLKTASESVSMNLTEYTEVIAGEITTTVGTGAVLVTYIANLRGLNDGGSDTAQFRLKRGGLVLFETSAAVRGVGGGFNISERTMTISYMDTGRAGGVSVSYSIDAIQTGSSTEARLLQAQRLTLFNLGA